MEIFRTPIEDLIIFRPTPIRDERGYFSRTLDIQILADAGIDPASFKQENQSRSYQGVRRGLHGRSGAGEAKLVRCANGVVLDVVVDARPGSATFGQVMTLLLDDQLCTQVYIPRGFLHGFQALTAVTDVVYRIDEFHAPNSDVTVRHDDPELAVPWPAPPTIMSARDREKCGNDSGLQGVRGVGDGFEDPLLRHDRDLALRPAVSSSAASTRGSSSASRALRT